MVKLSPVSRKKFEKFLLYIGCRYKRTSGDHLVYSRDDLKRPVIFTADKEVPTFIVRNNLRTLGFSYEQFLETLKRT